MYATSRTTAFAQGLKEYSTGKPCKNGHISPRYVSTGGCIACLRQYSAGFVAASAPGTAVFPAQHMHPDDHAQMYQIVDHLNQARGLDPAVRAGVSPTPFEFYLRKEMAKPPSVRPPLNYIESSAVARGMEVRYQTMTRPVDTWTGKAQHIRELDTTSEEQAAINARHNASLKK